MSPEWSSRWWRSTRARVTDVEPTGPPGPLVSVLGQGPTHGLGDLFAGRTDRVPLGITPRHPDLAAERDDRRGVDHRPDHGVVQRHELAVFWGVALENDVRESFVILIVELRRRGHH